MSENLRQEYDRQLANIRNLRALYDERARVNAAERENLNRQLETSRAELASEIEKFVHEIIQNACVFFSVFIKFYFSFNCIETLKMA